MPSLQYMLSRLVDTYTLDTEGILQARAWAAVPADKQAARAAAVKAAAKEWGDGRTVEEESMERKWESAWSGLWRESGLRREFQEATSRAAGGTSSNTAKAAGRRGRGREA
uniref:Uncharacterized protein n=1 Tax=Oryza brachyantha TaxID=4533 RepID=J3L006_ORYBR